MPFEKMTPPPLLFDSHRLSLIVKESSVAQLAEWVAFDCLVVGSSPIRGIFGIDSPLQTYFF